VHMQHARIASGAKDALAGTSLYANSIYASVLANDKKNPAPQCGPGGLPTGGSAEDESA